MKWRNGLAALIGVWFIIAPWVLHFSGQTAAMWLSVVVGAIQLITSAWAMFLERSTGWKQWQSWVSVLTGVWFIVQPFIFSQRNAEIWTSVILGAVTIILHLWSMGVKDDTYHSDDKTHAHAS